MRQADRSFIAVLSLAVLLTAACAEKKVDETAAAPPQTKVVEEGDPNIIKVEHADRFTIVEAGEHEQHRSLDANGTISPDVDFSVPVISLASGRALALYAKLGDDVKKGQLLLKVQSTDIANAVQTYLQAKADEQLAQTQLDRAKLLYSKGAIALNDLQVAQDTYDKARVARIAAEQTLHNLGATPDQQTAVINVYAPATGTIVEQNIVPSASVHTPDNQANLFTIADLSTVWALCDVYENDLEIVRIGDLADVKLNGYPQSTFHGRISNISKVLDPTTRSAKVRIVLRNPGMMRTGMFVTATFYGRTAQLVPIVPSTAILHLHDKDWVFTPAGDNTFRRVEVRAGASLPNNMQVVSSGLKPGDRVVKDALSLQAESDQ